MNLAHFSVRRPVLTTMVTLIVVILGGVSLTRLRTDLLPSVEMPTMSVRTSYEGASPEVMERLVTQMLEEIVKTVPGVEEITSETREGSSRINVTFVWGTDIDSAAVDVRATIEDEINELPPDIERPRISKFDIDSFPVVLIGVSADLDWIELTETCETQIRNRFSRIPGVAQVDLWGGYHREIRVELDPDRIKAFGLALDSVLDAINDANLDLPTGRIEEGQYEVTLRAPANLENLDQFREIVIDREGDVPVVLSQVATIKDTHQRLTRIDRINGQPGIRVAIRKQAEANTVEVSEAILEEIKRVNAAFPHLKVIPVINQGNFITRSIENVAYSVLYGAALAIIILLFFLRNLRSTFVISLAIPISVISTFATMYLGGLTINLMTLGGLALGVGMMVDSSIVVLENIYRHRDELKEPPDVAAVKGTNEVGPAIIASTITTLVIFLPLIFIGEVAGMLFKDLAIVIVYALVCSLLVSLSLVPVLAAKILKGDEADRPERRKVFGGLLVFAEKVFNGLEGTYRDILNGILRMRWLCVLVCFGLLAASWLLTPFIGSEFLPPSDEGEVRVTGEMETGTRMDLVSAQTKKMEEIAVPIIEKDTISKVVRVRNGQGEIRLTLKPATERSVSNEEYANQIRKALDGQVAGMKIKTRAPKGQFLLERILGGDDGLTIEIRGPELDTLSALAELSAKAIEGIEGVTEVDIDREDGSPQQEIIVDRAKVADLGMSVRDVASLLRTAIAGSQAGEFRTQGHLYRIFVQLADAEHRSIEEILDLPLTTPDGQQVALRNVVEASPSRGPTLIERKDGERLIKVTANVEERDLGSVAEEMQGALDEIPRPTGYDLAVSGKYEAQQTSFKDLQAALLLALVLVYMVLAAQYESFRDPLVVMFSVPVAGIGVIVTLFLTNTTINLQSFIGCIMLGGIVVNNAILLVDQANQLTQGSLPVDEAITEAGRRRLRPILMTTATTIIGLVPLAFGIGEGADAQAPLARAVVGGLITSTVITLCLIPAVYSLMHPLRRRRVATI